jgi:hypothetical protein
VIYGSVAALNIELTMLDLYYKIWVDAIITEKAKKSEGRNWKLYTIIPISMLQGINLFTFFYWMKKLVNRNLPLVFGVDIFNARLINAFISIVLTLFIPFVIFNYLMIFNNNRYKFLIGQNKPQSVACYKIYALVSIGLLAVPIIIEKMFF